MALVRLYIVFAFIVLEFLLLPFRSSMAVSASSGWYTPFIYMFAHANILHCALNCWCLLLLNNILTAHRLIAAYLSSVLVGILYGLSLTSGASSSGFLWLPLASSPLLGLSTILFFLTGYLIPYYRRHRPWHILPLCLFLIVGLFIPNIAGAVHLALCVMGFIYYHCEGFIRRLLILVTEEEGGHS